jgi:hypothetical protein
LPAGPPSASGPTGNEAPPDLAEYWPGGDPTRLRAAAAAWGALAEQLDEAAYGADSAFRIRTYPEATTGGASMLTWIRPGPGRSRRPTRNPGGGAQRDLILDVIVFFDLSDEQRTVHPAPADPDAAVAGLKVSE